MQKRPDMPVSGAASNESEPPANSKVTVRRSVAKAVSWRVLGTIDTLILSFLLITYLGPIVGLQTSTEGALETSGLIAVTEVATKMTFYFIHERAWAASLWGVSYDRGRRSESMRRTTVKTVTWRTIASLDTVVLALIYTGNAATAISIGGLEVFTKMTLYFFHERLWTRLTFGLGKIAPIEVCETPF